LTKPYQWLAWVGTAALLISATLASFNLYPYYSWGFIVANSIWMIVGMLWKERSVIISNAGLNTVYIIGLFFAQ
jgi:hypothetical protein